VIAWAGLTLLATQTPSGTTRLDSLIHCCFLYRLYSGSLWPWYMY